MARRVKCTSQQCATLPLLLVWSHTHRRDCWPWSSSRLLGHASFNNVRRCGSCWCGAAPSHFTRWGVLVTTPRWPKPSWPPPPQPREKQCECHRSSVDEAALHGSYANWQPFTFHSGLDTGARTDVACDTSHAKDVPKLFGRSSRDRRVLGRWAVAPHCLASAWPPHNVNTATDRRTTRRHACHSRCRPQARLRRLAACSQKTH